MTRTILCVGFLTDPTFQHSVRSFGERAQRPPLVVDLGAARNGFWAHHDEESAVCRIRTDKVDLTLREDEVSLYQRLMPVMHGVRAGTRSWRGFKLAHYVFERLLDAQFFSVVVNPLLAGWNNGARPIHYRFLAQLGFRIPPWLVTNDPAAARRFVADHGGAVFVKSVSSHRTISSRFSRVHADGLESLPNAPTLFQQAIHGPEVRVHVVGDRCFGVRITSPAEDYRHPGACPVEYAPAEVPPAVAARCVEATQQLGLILSGIDLKICERTGEWYCLEANRTPGYAHDDRHLGGQIADALVQYLERPPPRCEGPRARPDGRPHADPDRAVVAG